jgi:hypothetical protein
VPVAHQKLFDPKRTGRKGRADEYNISDAGRDQLNPPENEGPHQDVADLSIGLHYSQHLLAIYLDQLARLGGAFERERRDRRAC